MEAFAGNGDTEWETAGVGGECRGHGSERGS